MKDNNNSLQNNYGKFEYYVKKEDRMHTLNSYALINNKLSLILSPYSSYINAFRNNLNVIKNPNKRLRILRNKINSTQLMYF